MAITGDLQYDDDPANNEVNGIAATPNGRTLFVVQSNTGRLFRVDAARGVSTEVTLTGGEGGLLPNADGILLDGRTLYVVQNRLNKIAVVRVSNAGARAGSSSARSPTPLSTSRRRSRARATFLFAPNARFGVAPSPDNEFAVVRVPPLMALGCFVSVGRSLEQAVARVQLAEELGLRGGLRHAHRRARVAHRAHALRGRTPSASGSAPASSRSTRARRRRWPRPPRRSTRSPAGG